MNKMMKMLVLASMVFAFAATVGAMNAQAASYTYVGSWDVNAGPWWCCGGPFGGLQGVESGRQAAAQIFGGAPGQYAISTNGSDPNLINFSTWVSRYAQGHSGDIVGQDYIQDGNGNGIYDETGDSSAFIGDWCSDGNCINSAFIATPEPASLGLLGLGLLGLATLKRRQN